MSDSKNSGGGAILAIILALIALAGTIIAALIEAGVFSSEKEPDRIEIVFPTVPGAQQAAQSPIVGSPQGVTPSPAVGGFAANRVWQFSLNHQKTTCSEPIPPASPDDSAKPLDVQIYLMETGVKDNVISDREQVEVRDNQGKFLDTTYLYWPELRFRIPGDNSSAYALVQMSFITSMTFTSYWEYHFTYNDVTCVMEFRQ